MRANRLTSLGKGVEGSGSEEDYLQTFAATRTPDTSFARSQVPDDWRGIANPCPNEAALMGFGRPMHPGQSLGHKNPAESLKMAALCGEGFLTDAEGVTTARHATQLEAFPP